MYTNIAITMMIGIASDENVLDAPELYFLTVVGVGAFAITLKFSFSF